MSYKMNKINEDFEGLFNLIPQEDAKQISIAFDLLCNYLETKREL